MKKLLFILGFTAFVLWVCCSCSKEYNPCGKAIWITKIYADSAGHWIKDSVIWETGSVVCGDQFNNYKIESEQKERDQRYSRFCVNGVTQYWIRNEIKIEY